MQALFSVPHLLTNVCGQRVGDFSIGKLRSTEEQWTRTEYMVAVQNMWLQYMTKIATSRQRWNRNECEPSSFVVLWQSSIRLGNQLNLRPTSSQFGLSRTAALRDNWLLKNTHNVPVCRQQRANVISHKEDDPRGYGQPERDYKYPASGSEG